MYKTVFFGTDEYAADLLKQLISSDLVSVDLVITQPDKPVGRKKVLTPPPVKLIAEKHTIQCLQPDKLRKEAKENKSLISNLQSLDLGIVTRYGQIIPTTILEAPKKGLLNIHPSLLPLYRGATPLQSALLDGQKKTGVAIMRMDDGVDTGDVLGMEEIDVAPDDTYETLSEKLTHISADLLLTLLPGYMDGSRVPQKQDDTKATLCQQFTKEDGRVDWNKTAQEIYNQFRGIGHWPGLWTTIDNKRLKLLTIEPHEKTLPSGVIATEDDRIYIGASKGSILVHQLQLEGKAAMSATQFLQGNAVNGLSVV